MLCVVQLCKYATLNSNMMLSQQQLSGVTETSARTTSDMLRVSMQLVISCMTKMTAEAH